MKKYILIIILIISTIILFFVGEQVFYYFKHEKKNLFFVLSNQSSETPIDISVLIDGKAAYDTIMILHPGYLYYDRKRISFGRHEIEIKNGPQSLYKEHFFTLMNRNFIIDYCDGRVVVFSSSRPMMIQ